MWCVFSGFLVWVKISSVRTTWSALLGWMWFAVSGSICLSCVWSVGRFVVVFVSRVVWMVGFGVGRGVRLWVSVCS